MSTVSVDPPRNEKYSAHAGCRLVSSVVYFKEAMKDMLLLLFLLCAQTIKVGFVAVFKSVMLDCTVHRRLDEYQCGGISANDQRDS